MFSRILVPLDGSKTAEKALPYARDLARPEGCVIHLVRVSATELIMGGAGVSHMGGYPVPQSILETELRAQRDELTRLQAELQREGYAAASHLLRGDPASAILDTANREACDLIVMTSHGRTGLSRFLLGSVAERVARHCNCPVLIVGRESLKANDPEALAESEQTPPSELVSS